MIVYLLPIGRDRFELYSEPPEESGAPPYPEAGRLRQWAHAANVRWHQLVDSARRNRSTGQIARGRDALVRRLAETIAEQRTLWALAKHTQATLLYPASLVNVPRAVRASRVDAIAARLNLHRLSAFFERVAA